MANWEYVRIGDVCTVERGGSPRPIDKFITDDPNGINWIKIGDTDDSMYITKTAQKIIPEGMKKSRYVQPGDFLLSNSMSFGRPYILKIDGCIHDGWLVLRDNNGIFDKRFLYYYLSSPSTYQKFKNMAVGGVVNNLNSEMVRGVTVPVPTMDEQLNVVSVLDKVTELIALRKEQLAKLDQLVKSRFIELLQPYFDKGETQPLINFVCDTRPITYGILKPGTDCEGGYPVIRVKDFSRGLVSEKEVLHTTPEIYNKYLRSVLEEGDIILSIGGTIGRIAIIPKEFAGANITQHTARIALKDKRYLFYFRGLLESDMMQRWMKERVLGVAQPSINLGDVKQIPIPIVDECVIKELNTFVEQTDKSKLAIQQSLDKLELLKKSLMQEYFG